MFKIKNIVLTLTAFSLLIVPVSADAITESRLQSEIGNLQLTIDQYLSSLAKLQSSGPNCTVILSELRKGDRDDNKKNDRNPLDEVRELKEFLSNQGYNVGNINGTFNSKTEKALYKFQTDNNIPIKSKETKGYDRAKRTGPLTRAKIESISCSDDGGGGTRNLSLTSTPIGNDARTASFNITSGFFGIENINWWAKVDCPANIDQVSVKVNGDICDQGWINWFTAANLNQNIAITGDTNKETSVNFQVKAYDASGNTFLGEGSTELLVPPLEHTPGVTIKEISTTAEYVDGDQSRGSFALKFSVHAKDSDVYVKTPLALARDSLKERNNSGVEVFAHTDKYIPDLNVVSKTLNVSSASKVRNHWRIKRGNSATFTATVVFDALEERSVPHNISFRGLNWTETLNGERRHQIFDGIMDTPKLVLIPDGGGSGGRLYHDPISQNATVNRDDINGDTGTYSFTFDLTAGDGDLYILDKTSVSINGSGSRTGIAFNVNGQDASAVASITFSENSSGGYIKIDEGETVRIVGTIKVIPANSGLFNVDQVSVTYKQELNGSDSIYLVNNFQSEYIYLNARRDIGEYTTDNTKTDYYDTSVDPAYYDESYYSEEPPAVEEITDEYYEDYYYDQYYYDEYYYGEISSNNINPLSVANTISTLGNASKTVLSNISTALSNLTSSISEYLRGR